MYLESLFQFRKYFVRKLGEERRNGYKHADQMKQDIVKRTLDTLSGDGALGNGKSIHRILMCLH